MRVCGFGCEEGDEEACIPKLSNTMVRALIARKLNAYELLSTLGVLRGH